MYSQFQTKAVIGLYKLGNANQILSVQSGLQIQSCAYKMFPSLPKLVNNTKHSQLTMFPSLPKSLDQNYQI